MGALGGIVVIFALVVMGTGAWGLCRGGVGWARLATRKASGAALGTGFAAFLVVGALNPTPGKNFAPTTTTAPSLSGASTSFASIGASTTSTPPSTLYATTTTVSSATARPTPVTTTPTAALVTPTATAAPATSPPTAAVVTPAPTVAPVSAATTTAAPAIRTGVKPGAFCAPEGDRGETVTGLPMVCTSTATDTRNRWRAA